MQPVGFVAAALLLAGSAGTASAATALCDRLVAPEGYAKVCESSSEGARRDERLVVRPSTRGLSNLGQLSLRPLVKDLTPLAWSDPARWLEEQVAIDVSTATSTLELLKAGPLAHPASQAAIDGITTALSGFGRLPLTGCTPATTGGQRELKCHWGPEPMALRLNVRLIESGDERFGVSYWSFDERSLGHLEAIANSFHG